VGRTPEDEVYVVVFDVNVYLDVAEVVSQPFDWADFHHLAASVASEPLPHPTNGRLDSLRALAASRSGVLAGDIPLEIWTSDHIDRLVLSKAQSKVRASNGDLWTRENAEDLHDMLVNDLVYDLSHGGSVGRIDHAEGSPPLDHEDGCVFRTAMLAGDVQWAQRFCVTNDQQFRLSSPQLHPSVEVLYPYEYLTMLRAARRADALRKMIS